MRNPINTQLPRMKKQVVGASEREIWVAQGFIFFFFSFSFLFFIFLVSVVFRVAYFSFHLFLFYVLDLGVIVLS